MINPNCAKLIAIILFFFLPALLYAQTESKTPFFYSLDYRLGENNPTRESLKGLKSSYQGVELKFGWQTIGKKDWQVAYRYPSLGVGINLNKFDNRYLGDPYGIFFFTNFPQINSKLFRMDLEINLGLSNGMNPYDSIINTVNTAISSSLNIQSGFYLEQSFHLGNHFDLFASEGLTHISNGTLGFPNRGINVRTLKIGVRYQPNAELKQNRGEKLPFEHRWQINTFLGTGMKKYNNPTPVYHEYMIAPALYYQAGYKRRVGLGFEITYNETLTAYKPDKILGPSEKVTYAVNGSHEFIINRFTILTQLGYYVANKPFTVVKDFPVTWNFYQRVGLSYYLTDHVRLALDLKARYYIAEFIETGVIFDLNLN